MSEVGATVQQEVNASGRAMARRIFETYPYLSEGVNSTEVEVRFVKYEDRLDAPIATSVYEDDGTRLSKVEIDRARIAEQYMRIRDDVDFDELASVHVGIAICMDLLFQQTAKLQSRSTNVAIAMADFMGDSERIRRALNGVGPEFEASGYTDMAVEKMLYESDPLDLEKAKARAIRINAQRLAVGMMIESERLHGSDRGPAVVNAVQKDIRDQLTNKVSAIAIIGLATTGNFDVARRVVVDTIVDARDLPLAIPADIIELSDFFDAVAKADSKPEIIGRSILEYLMDSGIDDTDPEDRIS